MEAAMAAKLGFVATFALALVCALPARAEENQAAAANAFSRAQKALLSNDYDQAAELFELADSLAPTPQALRSAASARKAAGQLATAATRAEELLTRYPDDPESKKLANQILQEAKTSLSRHEVVCKPDPCQLLVDGNVVTETPKDRHFLYLKPGEHELSAVFGTRRAKAQKVKSEPGLSIVNEFETPPASAATTPAPVDTPSSSNDDVTTDTAPKKSGGLSPVIFGTAAGVTVILAGVATWSGLNTLSARDTYDENRTQEGYEDGQSKERRTNILFAATGVAAAATITIAIFTDWGGKKSARKGSSTRVSAGAAPGNAGLFLQGSF
jgi:hypothetical protein